MKQSRGRRKGMQRVSSRDTVACPPGGATIETKEETDDTLTLMLK
jgi:hypothetical protein